MESWTNYDLQNVYSPVDADILNQLLTQSNYDVTERQFLVNGFREGFSIGYQGPANRSSTSKNIPFLPGVGDEMDLWQKIMSEVKELRVAGPYEEVPFDQFIQSPVGLVPKSGGRTCMIFHLSFNFSKDLDKDGSLNHFTPADMCSV